jgi:DnaK suppressor protein
VTEPDLQVALEDERTATAAHVASLQRDFDGMVDASEASNADDEHDPEGATIAFERAQVAALLAQARGRLADIDGALEQLAAGAYGRCVSCGRPIAAERVAARPSVRTCIDCARRAQR